MRDLIHFAHGNGFPSLCYRQLLDSLQRQFDCCYLDCVGHSVHYPVTDNWEHLVEEVIMSIQTQSTQPVIAVGHSLGGVLSFQAAVQRPELFKALILLDAPILGRLKSRVLQAFKLVGLIDYITPAARAKRRRQHWATREQALAYFKTKKLFSYFTQSCLEDYIDYGMESSSNGYSLRFDCGIEYQIFRTLPHVLTQCEGKLRVPTVLIYGNRSQVIKRSDVRYMTRRYGITSYETKGTHMFPMEHPEAVANLIAKITGILLR